MAARWTGSPMRGASTGSSTAGNGRRECPYCHVPLIRIQSKQDTTKDQWFVKCPYNIKGDISTCSFICAESDYLAVEAKERQKEVLEIAGQGCCGVACCAHLKGELKVMKEMLDSVVTLVTDLGRMKHQVEAVDAPNSGVEKKNLQIVVDSAILVPVFAGFLGVLFGIVVAGMWK